MGKKKAAAYNGARTVPPYSILQTSKNCQFLNPPSHIVDVIYGWSLRQMYIDDIKMWARFCPKLIDFQSCNLGVCPEPTASPKVIDSKYNAMDCQCTVAVQNLKISS